LDRKAEKTHCDDRWRKIITIPRENPVDAYTMAGIIKDAGLTVEEFKNLL